MAETKLSICRLCINNCAIEVSVEHGEALKVRGHAGDPLYRGYTCVKGRSQPALLRHESRLLRTLKRDESGDLQPIALEQALDEIAARLLQIKDRHGARSIAAYAGTMAFVSAAQTAFPIYDALLDGLGTPMRFDPNTIDKGGKGTAQSFLGTWQAPSQGFDDPQAILLLGINPWQTYTGFPAGSSRRWLQDVMDKGTRLVVVDPRETHVAARADIHLQARPGHDARILTAMIKVLLDEGREDTAFVLAHVQGVPELRRLLVDLDVSDVAASAGVRADDLVAAARLYANARRGYAMAGTGPNMSGEGTLIEYLVLVLETLCGRWLRAGEEVVSSPCLIPAFEARAQADGPDEDWATGESLRVRGLKASRAGMPTAALPEEILTPGEGQVRALVSWAGNPAVAFPDQRLTVDALRSLELMVQIDPWLSESARLAHYVIAPTMPLEVPASTGLLDSLTRKGTGYGYGVSYANYTPAVVDRPEGSELVEDWQVFHGLMTRLGLPVDVVPFGHPPGSPRVRVPQGMTTEDLIQLMSIDSRVPISAVKERGQGGLYDDDRIIVGEAAPGHVGRLHVAHPEMMGLLTKALKRQEQTTSPEGFDFRLLCRRLDHINNTTINLPGVHGERLYNPAYMCPDDLEHLGLSEGEEVVITSSRGEIVGYVHPDASLRAGTVSMAFGFGTVPGHAADPRTRGSSPNLLVSMDEMFDPYTGQPRMTNVPVRVSART